MKTKQPLTVAVSRVNATTTRYALLCLLLGSLSWGQATASGSGLTTQPSVSRSAAPEKGAPDLVRDTSTPESSSNKPLITIAGLCNNSSNAKSAASDCQTVITKAQFEKIVKAIQPGMSAHAQREFALRYADALVMAKKAEQMGLDKGENYDQQMRLARIQVLSQDLKHVIEEKASQVSDADIEDYYHNNLAKFEKAVVSRIYVPKSPQLPPVLDKQESDADRQKRLQQSQQAMEQEAAQLQARAVAGEEFVKLQADAYQVAGIKSPAPNTTMEVRRISLPPNQTLIMDLKPGQVSSVLADPNGYVIYKLKVKELIPLDQAREEIKAVVRVQRLQDEMHAIQDVAIPTLDESYFVRKLPPQDVRGIDQPAKPAYSIEASKPK